MHYEYPLQMETRIALAVEPANSYALRAWELRLKPDATNDPGTGEYVSYPVPENLPRGYLGLVWDGSVQLKTREQAETDDSIESSFGVFFFDQMAEITLGEGASAARVAVIGVLDAQLNAPALELPGRGKPDDLVLPMPEIPDGGRVLTVILRELQFWDPQRFPVPENPEVWPRPGYFLTTIDGPRVGDECPEAVGGDVGDQLDFVALHKDQDTRFRSCDKDRPSAYIIDFYAAGDDVEYRDPVVTPAPGCTIRCWGP